MVAEPARQEGGAPRQIGPYTVDSRLSKGGMAAVYRAYDQSRRLIALKVATEGNAAALHAEAETLRQLDHPSIVKIISIFSSGQSEPVYIGTEVIDGRPLSYIALEYIEGGTLEQLVLNRRKRGETFAPPEILRIVGAIADALDYAHARGVLHLDVKPSNVLLSRDGRRVVLSDFGIGRRTELETARTNIGTPLYMSPEQALAQDVDHRSDLYSLGVVLYQLCTGRVPLDGTWDEVLRKLRVGAPIVPPTIARRDVPPDVQDVLVRVLDRDRNRRYENGAALVAALRQAMPFHRRRLQPLAILLAVVAIAVTVSVVALFSGKMPTGLELNGSTLVVEVTRESVSPTGLPAPTLTILEVESQASVVEALPTAAGTPTMVIVDPIRSRETRATPTTAINGDVPATVTLVAQVSIPSTPSPRNEPLAGVPPDATPRSTQVP